MIFAILLTILSIAGLSTLLILALFSSGDDGYEGDGE